MASLGTRSAGSGVLCKSGWAVADMAAMASKASRKGSLDHGEPHEFAEIGHPNHAGISPAGGSLTTLRLLICGWPRTSCEGLLRRLAVEVQDGDGLAAGQLPADGHLGDVDLVLAEDRADEADQARHVAVREDQHDAVHVGVEVVRAELHEAQILVAEQRARPRCRSSCR